VYPADSSLLALNCGWVTREREIQTNPPGENLPIHLSKLIELIYQCKFTIALIVYWHYQYIYDYLLHKKLVVAGSLKAVLAMLFVCMSWSRWI